MVHTDSIASVYSRLGGYLGETAKLGSLARMDLWAWVKGLLDKLITHFRLGSSSVLPVGEPWGLLTLALATCLLACGNKGWAALSPWELVLTAWGEALTAWVLELSACGGSAISLGDCADCLGISIIHLRTTCLDSAISVGVSPGYLRRGVDCLVVSILCLGTTCLWRVALSPWELVLAAWGEVLTAWEWVFSAWELPVCGGTVLSPWEIVLTAWGEALATWESVLSAQELPAWGEEVLAAWKPGTLPWELPAWGGSVLVLPAWGLALLVKQVIFSFLRSNLLNLFVFLWF